MTDADPSLLTMLADLGSSDIAVLDLRLFVALHIPGMSVGLGEDDGMVVLSTPTGHAQVGVRSGADWMRPVMQIGHRIWDTAEHALREWERLGHPKRSRYGISALDQPGRQHVWLDDPEGPYAWPLGA